MSNVEKKLCEHCGNVSIYPNHKLCEKCARNAEICAQCRLPDKDTGRGIMDLVCRNYL